jgi:hypothetical protein
MHLGQKDAFTLRVITYCEISYLDTYSLDYFPDCPLELCQH